MVDTGGVSGTQEAIDRIVGELVDGTAHVRGAVLGSADGHPLAASIDDLASDASSVAAMAAAAVGLSTQLVRVATDARTANTHVRSAGAQVWVLDVGRVATLTVYAEPHGDPAAIATAAQRTTARLVEALTPDRDVGAD
jgi:predicted regulator of Ras-like GTPase activity (Roadblock/LC7/MglB family)